MAKTTGLDPENKVEVCFDTKMFDVAYWVAHLKGDIGPGVMPSH